MKLTTEIIHGVFIVTFEGTRLDAPQAESFLTAMHDFIQKGNIFILLDMGNVTFMDSTGLGSMIRALQKLYSDGQLVICGVTSQVEALLKLTHLDDVFTITTDRTEAFDIFSPLMEKASVNTAETQTTQDDELTSVGEYVDLVALLNEDDSKEDTKGERRRYQRVKQQYITDEELFVHCRDVNSGKASNGVIIDISPGGFLMLSSTVYRVGDILRVECPIGRAFKMSETVVVRAIKKGKYGVEFKDISKDAKTFLLRLIGAVQRNR